MFCCSNLEQHIHQMMSFDYPFEDKLNISKCIKWIASNNTCPLLIYHCGVYTRRLPKCIRPSWQNVCTWMQHNSPHFILLCTVCVCVCVCVCDLQFIYSSNWSTKPLLHWSSGAMVSNQNGINNKKKEIKINISFTTLPKPTY